MSEQQPVTVEVKSNYVKAMFALAPKATLSAMRRWEYRERKSFIGNKDTSGLIRRTFLARKVRGGDDKYSPGAAKVFQGGIENPRAISGLTLKMGVFTKDEPYKKGVEGMEEGYSVSPVGGGLLMIPIRKNLKEIGVSKFGAKVMKSFIKRMYGISGFDIIGQGGRVLFFDDSGKRGGINERHKLLFIGLKQVFIHRPVGFYQKWQNRIPSVVKRGQTALDRMVRAIEKGYIEEK